MICPTHKKRISKAHGIVNAIGGLSNGCPGVPSGGNAGNSSAALDIAGGLCPDFAANLGFYHYKTTPGDGQ